MIFKTMHPLVPCVYVAITLGVTMTGMHPVLIVISLMGAVSFSAAMQGWRKTFDALRWKLPMFLLIALSNPLFSVLGSHTLFSIFGHAVTFEACVFGICMGLLFITTLLWFTCANMVISTEEVLSLFADTLPVLAMMMSMIMRLIPRFTAKACDIEDAQNVALATVSTEGERASRPLIERLPHYLRQSSVLMSWGMEDSLEAADSMRARGWGACRKRTTYRRYRLHNSDIYMLAFEAVAGLLTIVICAVATTQFEFYPTCSVLVAWWGYGAYAAWMMVPTGMYFYDAWMLRR